MHKTMLSILITFIFINSPFETFTMEYKINEHDYVDAYDESKALVNTMYTNLGRIEGTVEWYDKKKGYGFIVPDINLLGGRHRIFIFVHSSAVERSGFRYLDVGNRVSYEVNEVNGKIVATNIVDLL